MDRSDVIKLVSVTTSQDERGATRKVTNSRQVFCSVDSVSSAEFFRARQENLDATFKFVVFRYDYNGENLVEYNGEQYSIYRTYAPKSTDNIELYAERKAGTDGN